MGWDWVCQLALNAYICLNVIHCFPQIWDPASGRTDETDYRRSPFYQFTLRFCTKSNTTSEVAAHPHRQFFGIPHGQFLAQGRHWDKKRKHPYGILAFEHFLVSETSVGYQPDDAEVPQVRRMLRCKGLPAELALDILELADYVPRRRLKVPHDPFHGDNRGELDKYLKYCWQLLVRLDMLSKELGMTIRWRELVSGAIVHLWDLNNCDCRRRDWYEYEVGYDEDYYKFK